MRTSLRSALWACLTLAMALAAIGSAISPKGLQRIGMAAAPPASVAGGAEGGTARAIAALEARVARLAEQLDGLLAQAGSDAHERNAMRSRLAALESDLTSFTGSLPRRAGADSPGAGRVEAVHVDAGLRDGPLPAMAEPHVLRTRFAVELAQAQDIADLEDVWAAARAMTPAGPGALEPRVRLKRLAGGGTLLALIAGPIDNAQDAAHLCAQLKSLAPRCRPVAFTGPMLALEDGDDDGRRPE